MGNFLGYGSCRSANVWQYPNHYLKTGNVNSEECVAQCNADQGCTHMEWGLNGNREKQCVFFPRNSSRALHHVGGGSFLAMVVSQSPRQMVGRTSVRVPPKSILSPPTTASLAQVRAAATTI